MNRRNGIEGLVFEIGAKQPCADSLLSRARAPPNGTDEPVHDERPHGNDHLSGWGGGQAEHELLLCQVSAALTNQHLTMTKKDARIAISVSGFSPHCHAQQRLNRRNGIEGLVFEIGAKQPCADSLLSRARANGTVVSRVANRGYMKPHLGAFVYPIEYV